MEWLPKNPYNFILHVIRTFQRGYEAHSRLLLYIRRRGSVSDSSHRKTFGKLQISHNNGKEMCVGKRNREAPTKANINIKHERHENEGKER